MTTKVIQTGANRTGFKDWPTYDNKPGPDEPQIARCAIPDAEWIKEPKPRTYNKNKTVTGEKIAEKIRDLGLRRNLTGKTSMPRLYQKLIRSKSGPMRKSILRKKLQHIWKAS